MNDCSLTEDVKSYISRYEKILGRMIAEMSGARTTNGISHNFIVRMLPHHRAAVEMSENIFRYTQNDELISIAQNIVSSQMKSIENMQTALRTCSLVKNTKCELADYNSAYRAISGKMFFKMRTAPVCRNNDINFIREMIPHHEGAIEMSQSALEFNICPPLVPILQAIITSQTKGVEQMKELLEKLRN